MSRLDDIIESPAVSALGLLVGSAGLLALLGFSAAIAWARSR